MRALPQCKGLHRESRPTGRRPRDRPVGAGGACVGAGWSSAALGSLEHAAEGGEALRVATDAICYTPTRAQLFALNRVARREAGKSRELSGFWGLDARPMLRRL